VKKKPLPEEKKPAKVRTSYAQRSYTAAQRANAERVRAVLEAAYPEAKCALDHVDAWQLLVATVLSAQCTDARVNLVTPALFRALPTPLAMSQAPSEVLEDLIRSTGFYRNKAKSLSGAAKRVTEAFGGRVPEAMDDLLTIPGIGRKTANVVRGVAYGLADGVVVDTHVFRISRLLGWTKAKDPEKVERDLMALFPKEHWIDLGHLLITHGRRICIARRPKCPECPVSRLCPSSTA
jgi:endonuclease-3